MRTLQADRIKLLYRIYARTVTKHSMTKGERYMMYTSLVAHGYVIERYDNMGFYHLELTDKGLTTLNERKAP